jgi:hypothetical protein
MGLRNFELFPIYWILIFEMNLVLIVPGQPQIVFVQADCLLVLEQDVDVPFSEFVRNLQVAMSCDLVSRQLGPRSVWNIALDGRTDLSGGVICEGVELVILNFYDAHNVVSHKERSF